MTSGKQTTGKMLRVLAIEDDQEWRDFLCMELGVEYQVSSASTFEEGLQIAKRIRPDLIVMDVMLAGGMDGLSGVCELGKDPVTSDIPVVIMTEVFDFAGPDLATEQVSSRLGKAARVVLCKPVTGKKLRQVVGGIFGKNRDNARSP